MGEQRLRIALSFTAGNVMVARSYGKHLKDLSLRQSPLKLLVPFRSLDWPLIRN